MALAALRGEKTLAELARQYDVYPNQITQWKAQLLERATDVFGGEPTLENDFLEGALIKAGMGIEAHYRKPNTSARHPRHAVYPYLLRGLRIDRPNRVWAMDITYIPMARGFVYLAVVMDRYSRRALAWRLSISMETDFCLAAVEAAIHRHGAPKIFNTHQGSQFTNAAFIGLLKERGIRIGMDGKGCWETRCVCRTTVEVGQVRGGLSPRLRVGLAGQGWARQVLRFLQHSPTPFES